MKAKRKKASALFQAATELDDDLLKILSDEGLDKIAVGCGRAGILSVEVFRDHSVEELEESLKRSVALGAKWKLGVREKRILAKYGIIPGFMAPPAAAELDDDLFGETESVGGEVDFSKAFTPLGGITKPTTVGDSSKLLRDCPLASRLLSKVVLDYDTRDTIAGPFVHNILFMLATAAESKAVATLEEDCEGSIDSLDLLLGQLIEKGILTKEGLIPPGTGTRPTSKHAKALAHTISEAIVKVSKPASPAPDASEASHALLAKAIMASTGGGRLTHRERGARS
jgi:hypothetical protein